jgi:hypothetical protein
VDLHAASDGAWHFFINESSQYRGLPVSP